MDSSTDQFKGHLRIPVNLEDAIKLLRPGDFVCRYTPGKTADSTKMLGFREKRLAAPECLLRLLSFTDISDKARKCFVTVSGYLAEGDLYGKLLATLAKCGQFGALPIHMPLTGSQVAFEPGLVEFTHVLRHEEGQGFPHQFGWVVAKNCRSGRVGQHYCAFAINAHNRIAGGFDH